jgi:hypothetical protein
MFLKYSIATQEKSVSLLNYVCTVLAGATNEVAGFNRGIKE